VVRWSHTRVGCVASTIVVVAVVVEGVVVPASRSRSLGMVSLVVAVACGEHTWKEAVLVVVAFVVIVVEAVVE